MKTSIKHDVWILGSVVMTLPTAPLSKLLSREWVLHVLQYAYDTTGDMSQIIGKW